MSSENFGWKLKEKIQTMKIDIGINTANITNAIQQALYAKEIAQNYRKADFYDLFIPNLKKIGFLDTINMNENDNVSRLNKCCSL